MMRVVIGLLLLLGLVALPCDAGTRRRRASFGVIAHNADQCNALTTVSQSYTIPKCDWKKAYNVSDNHCADFADTSASDYPEYNDYTATAAKMFCSNQIPPLKTREAWMQFFLDVSRWQISYLAHELDLTLVNITDSDHGKVMLVKGSGRQCNKVSKSQTSRYCKESDYGEDCEMTATLQIHVCSNATSCCPDNGLIKVRQSSGLSAASLKTQCSKWFTGVGATVDMMVSNLRANIIQQHTIINDCSNKDNPEVKGELRSITASNVATRSQAMAWLKVGIQVGIQSVVP